MWCIAYLLPALVIADPAHRHPGRATSIDLPATLAAEDRPNSLHISAHGDLIRREVGQFEATELAETQVVNPAPSGAAPIETTGAVQVVAQAQNSGEQIRLTELTEECLMEQPTAECMEKFGSYGVRKLYTERWDNVKKLEYRRPGWMSHPEVQKQKLHEVTFPGTANSGTYAIHGNAITQGTSPYGVISQNFDFYAQLQLGVRAFDVLVAYSLESKLVYISHGSLIMPLATALRDMRRFLEEHEREVVILDVRKDPIADITHLKPLNDEEALADKIPGQLVHEAVSCELKAMLATHATLSGLPTDQDPANPTLGALTDKYVNVIYFYEGQQVLCTTYTECQTTPGWLAKDLGNGFPYAFGPPQKIGDRARVSGAAQTATVIEPACMVHSSYYTADERPHDLLKKVKEFAADQKGKLTTNPPKCFPSAASYPEIHTPTIMYTIDGRITSTPEEQTIQNDRMRGVKAIYTRGEAYTARTDAERVNYLLLQWFLKKDNQQNFLKPNVISFEFAGSAAMCILRIIEAVQKRPECSYAIYCMESGSCWANTMLRDTEDTCKPEDDVMEELKEHAHGVEDTTKWVISATIIMLIVFVICVGGFAARKIREVLQEKKSNKAKLAEAQKKEGVEEKEELDHESTLPGSEAASDYEPDTNEPSGEGVETKESSGAGVFAP